MLLPFCCFVVGSWAMGIKAEVAGYSAGCFCFEFVLDESYFLSRDWEQVMSGRESCLLGVVPVELLIRHWSLLLALRLFLVMALGGLFKVVRL